jgi:hypothetical protein
MNTAKQQAALQRIRDAITARDVDNSRICRIAFDPRRGDRDPATDLGALGIEYQMLLVRRRATTTWAPPGAPRGADHCVKSEDRDAI